MRLDLKVTSGLLKVTVMLSSFGLCQMAQAQFCALTNASLKGSYGYSASESGTPPATTTGTGTTGTTGTTGGTTPNTYSTTEIGILLNGITTGSQFAVAGVMAFDGQGNISAISAPTGTAVAQIGTYNVNSDCSLTVSLTDAFGTNTTATQLAGIILGRGTEVDLTSAASLQTPTGTTTDTPITPTPTGTGLTIRLVRVLYQNGCSNFNLNGMFGFVLNPSSMQTATATTGTTATSTQPPALIGYLNFNGAGQIVAAPTTAAASSSASSTLALQYTGTYTVYPDCSGTMTISNSSTASTTGTTTTMGTTTTTGTTTTDATTTSSITVNFVITPSIQSGNSGNSAAGAQYPELAMSFSTATESGSGYALIQ